VTSELVCGQTGLIDARNRMHGHGDASLLQHLDESELHRCEFVDLSGLAVEVRRYRLLFVSIRYQ
jgi:hypothetical protein